MLTIRICLVLSAWVAIAVLADQSTREKIALHKAWMLKRAQLKKTMYIQSTDSSPSSYGHIAYLKTLARRGNDDRTANEVIEPIERQTTSTTTTTTEATINTTPAPLPTNPPTTTTTTLTPHKVSTATRRKPAAALRKPNRPYWGGWDRWTSCSRSCGGGVTTQVRHCYVRLPTNDSETTAQQRQPSSMCIGVQKRHRVCNEESCADPDEDFRQTQCSQYNNVTFHGKQYEWEAYVKDDAECELNCKPVGMDYFAMLDAHVTDGTPCTQPMDAYRRQHKRRESGPANAAHRPAICVEGLCKTIHSGGIITATLMNEGTVRCGMLVCRPISGVFVDNPLQEGYSLVATIPKGSSNISITELMHSANRLALRAIDDELFAINADETEPTGSGTYDVANAQFDYRQLAPDDADDSSGDRRPAAAHRGAAVTEWLTSTGPISQTIEVMVLAFDRNPGVRFEYLVPTVDTNEHLPPTSDEYSYEESAESNSVLSKSNPTRPAMSTSTSTTTTTTTTAAPSIRPRRKRRFLWKITGFESCSKTCGGGIQMPVIRCVRESPLRVFVAKKCAHLPRPDASEHTVRCNSHACPGYWKIGEWSKCDCGDAKPQTRDVKCVQELGTGMVIQIPAVACTEQRPPAEQNCAPCRVVSSKPTRMAVLSDQAASPALIIAKPVRQRRPHHQTQSTAVAVDDKDRGVWLASAWSDECARNCDGTAIEHRTIFCDRVSKFTKRCELTLTPETSRQCQPATRMLCEHGEWLVGNWSACNGDCFNLTQSRQVVCGRDGRILDAVSCAATERPLATRSCNAAEVPHCQPQWHYSAWSECTKPCAGGNRRRTVKCVRPIGTAMKESDVCKYPDREVIFQACNVHECVADNNAAADNEATPAELIQNDTDPDCIDKMSTCEMVQKEHLCGNSYFQAHCCYTCTKHDNAQHKRQL